MTNQRFARARVVAAVAMAVGLGAGSVAAAAPASAADYSPPCGKVSLATWSAKNISCSKTIRHVNYVKNDGYYYHAWVSKGATSTASRCYIGANKTSFQVNGDGGLTGYGI
ncbi:hypothetical protein [Leifsonia sp. NCR5]|uniref:hypothetical protein n=1 Tax=Leifsonia sp. NCR5 TaxID=1978342 RepID=UPI00117AD091|nr:hypothetical protein [Leifsonia sp. NCR5]